jgi:protein-tyrosine phosphatase
VPPCDLSFITRDLAVGACFHEAALPWLVAQGITRVVDVRHEARDDEALLSSCGVKLLHLPTRDRNAIDPAVLDLGTAWVLRELDEGQRVLIHCQYGIGRSALLALCVLVAAGWAPMSALVAAKAAREIVSPSPQQLQAFVDFCRRRKRAALASWDLPGLEALMAVAYRHLHGARGTGGPQEAAHGQQPGSG